MQMKTQAPTSQMHQGMSLLITLIVISVIVVLFTIMARMVTIDKRVSTGYSNILRAEMAAQAGVADAGELLLDLFEKYPDSVTYWEPKMGEAGTPGTVFMYRDLPPNKEYIGSNSSTQVFARPLISGAETKPFYPSNEFDKTLPAEVVEADLSLDINQPGRFNEYSDKGWVGAPPGMTTLPEKPDLEIRVPWVNVKDKDGRVVSRYAYWIEDESFKLNLNATHERLRGDMESEQDPTSGEYKPLASLRGLFDSSVSKSVYEARQKMTATDEQMLSPLQIGHATMLPTDMTAEQFGREYRYLLTTESTALNLSRAGAKRLNLNEVVEKCLDDTVIPKVAYASSGGGGRTGPDLSVEGAPVLIRQGVKRISQAIQHEAPYFGQRFYRLQAKDVLIPTANATAVASKNNLDVEYLSGSPSHAEMYVNKIAANLFDYISPAVNPTVLDIQGNIMLGTPIYADDLYDTMGPENGAEETTSANWLAAMGKKRLPYFTEYMCNAKRLNRTPIKEGNSTKGFAEYDLEIDHYFEFWNMTNKDIVPTKGDMGPKPYLVIENQPPISVDNRGGSQSALPNQNVPAGRPFEIKLDEPFLHNGGDEDLVFKAGSVTIITTDPNYATAKSISSWLAGKQVYAANKLYIPRTNDRCDDPSLFSTQPFLSGEGSTSASVPNVRRYRLISFDNRDSEGNEIQMGPDMIGSTTMKLTLGNQFGLLTAHPSLCMGPTVKNMIVFKPGGDYYNQFRGSFVGGDLAGLYDPRSSLEAIDISLRRISLVQDSSNKDDLNAMPENNSMMVLNGQKKGSNNNEKSHLGLINAQAFLTSQLWDTDKVTTTQGPDFAPMLIEEGPMRSLGELGRIFDPLRIANNSLTTVKQRRAGGRTLTVGQPDAAWDGTRTSSLPDPEMKFQTSRSRGWTAWRLADIFTVRDEDSFKDTAKVEVKGLYNPNGILRDNGMVLRAMLEGINFGSGNRSDPALQGNVFDTTNMAEILEADKRLNMFPAAAGTGGQALANYLAQRLTRDATKKFSPLWEPGELSQLDFFSLKIGTTSYPFIKSSVKNNLLSDQGREEIFNRLVDMITLKGNTFSIYVVGQALNKLGKPISTKAQRVTVRLRPVFEPALKDDFDPDDAAAVDERFRAPDAYTLEIVNTEDA